MATQLWVPEMQQLYSSVIMFLRRLDENPSLRQDCLKKISPRYRRQSGVLQHYQHVLHMEKFPHTLLTLISGGDAFQFTGVEIPPCAILAAKQTSVC